MERPYCEHCWPTRRRSHAMMHVDYYLSRALPTFSGRACAYLWDGLLDALLATGIARLDRDPDRAALHNRSLIFFDEARRRGLDIAAVRVGRRYVGDFRVVADRRRRYFNRMPLAARWPSDVTDDKAMAKRVLERAGVPVPEGRRFSNTHAAVRYGTTIGFPLVVKPCGGSLGHHVTCDIADEPALREAITVARRYSPAFVVERHIPGRLYRATVIGGEHVFVCRKDQANVIGDGISTTEELIDAKNTHPWRGPENAMDATLHAIPKDDALDRNLAGQGLSRTSVPRAGQKIILHEKRILSQGCDIIACTADTHPDNLALFLDIAAAFGEDLIGIDFICADIAVSHREQTAGVIETNGLPYADMHQYPSAGPPEPVARAAWDVYLRRAAGRKDVLNARKLPDLLRWLRTPKDGHR